MGDDERTPGETGIELISVTRDGRVDTVLAEARPGLSRARLQRLIAGGHVRVNGELVRKSLQVRAGDNIALEEPAAVLSLPAAAFDLPVLYEDDSLVAVDKPGGLTVHGAPGDTAPSVAGWFAARYPGAAAQFGVERPGIVHRLDKDTTGVLLLAKTPAAQAALSAAFEARTVEKQYLAVCEGEPRQARAVVDAPIARHPGDRMRMAVVKHGRDARTAYETLATDHDRSLLLVRPETGRTHQIRVHLAAIGAPVAEDRVYGSGTGERQLLHAWRITVPHPDGGRLTVTAPLPADMVEAVRAMGASALALTYSQPVPPERTGDAPDSP